MPILALLKNYKLILAGIAALALFWGGWHSHTVYDGYIADKAKTDIIKKLGDSQNEIIKFNGAITKALKTSSDDCINRNIDPAIRMLIK